MAENGQYTGRIRGGSVQGIASDLDGTLARTTSEDPKDPVSWNRANEIAVARYGAEVEPRHLEGLPDGATSLDVAARLVAAVAERDASRVPAVEEMARANDEAMAGLIREHGVAPMPGAVPLLDRLAEANVPVAMVTASSSGIVDAVASAIPGLRHERFVDIVANDTEGLAQTKPAPDPYLKAAGNNGWSPGNVVALEDSSTGVASATAAGMPLVHVTGAGPVRTRHGRMEVASLDQVTPDHLRYFGALNVPDVRTPDVSRMDKSNTKQAAPSRPLSAVIGAAPRPARAFAPTGGGSPAAAGTTPREIPAVPVHIRNVPVPQGRDRLHTVAREIGLG